MVFTILGYIVFTFKFPKENSSALANTFPIKVFSLKFLGKGFKVTNYF